MSLRRTCGNLSVLIIFVGIQYAHAQQAVSSPDQARLVQQLSSSSRPQVTADGMATGDTTSDDEFGKIMILQQHPQLPTFVITGDASVFYTNNAALTPNNTIDDTFFVASASMSWTPQINPQLSAQVVAYSSIFRYDKTPSLDFQSFGLGTGLFWNPENFAGVGLFARYDFVEMLDRHSDEILRDHEFTLGAQKNFPIGPLSNFVVGATLMAGIAEPESAQRDQVGPFLAYRYQITRSFGLEFVYRFAGQFYNDTGRIDFNQILSASAYYQLWKGADLNAFFSFTDNRSDDSAFDYDAVSTGAGLSAVIQF